MVLENLVIGACAGSGKTHRLIRRFLLLLKNGAKPREILAITFTKKAAAEIRRRLLDALEKESANDDDLRICWRRILLAESEEDVLTIHTFHGWFLTVVENRPWSGTHWGSKQLAPDESPLFEEAWQNWLAKPPPPALRETLESLSPFSLKEMVRDFVGEINAWRLFSSRQKTESATADAAIRRAKKTLQKTQTAAQKSARIFCDNARGDGATFSKVKSAGKKIAAGDDIADSLVFAFFTQKMTINANLQKNADKCGYVRELQNIQESLLAVLQAADDLSELQFNAVAVAVCEDFYGELTAVKDEQNVMSFDDLEYLAWQTVRDDWGALSERLGYRYRHLLIDEFQDASLLQWQIVRHWLHDAHGNDDSPSVFLVGDVKQAIYGFRHGDARLLSAADEFLRAHYVARRVEENVSYRCAPPLLSLVNATFGRWEGFVKHRPATINENLPGRVEWATYGDDGNFSRAAKTRPRIRNPLKERRGDAEEKRVQWAEAVADAAKKVLDGWQIMDGDSPRRCRPQDVLILLPRFTHAALLVDALAGRGISCAATGRRLSFMGYFECADVMDLIRVLLSPARSLSLARTLKSPIFSLSDEALNRVATFDDGDCLWEKLHRFPTGDSDSSLLRLRESATPQNSQGEFYPPPQAAGGERFAAGENSPAGEITPAGGRNSVTGDESLSAGENSPAGKNYPAGGEGELPTDDGSENKAILRAQILLAAWRRRVCESVLPAHDLLARFFAEGDIAARYRAAVPAPLRTRVSANLSRLLDLSLTAGDGNRPLLAQFLQEENSPDAAADDAGLRLMTVHAAKGLESPIVIVGDADFCERGDAGRAVDILINWPPGEAAPGDFVFCRRRSRRAFLQLKEQRQKARRRERDNLLYVALTRARQSAIIFLPPAAKEAGEDLQRALNQLCADNNAFGESFAGGKEISAPPETPMTVAAAKKAVGEVIVKTRQMAAGEHKHRLLSLLLAGFCEEEIRRLVTPLQEEMWDEAKKVSQTAAIKNLLKNCDSFFVESDIFVDGEIARPDLLIIQARAAWIIDYKSGDARPQQHRRQLQTYRAAVQKLYPTLPIKTAILSLQNNIGELTEVVL